MVSIWMSFIRKENCGNFHLHFFCFHFLAGLHLLTFETIHKFQMRLLLLKIAILNHWYTLTNPTFIQVWLRFHIEETVRCADDFDHSSSVYSCTQILYCMFCETHMLLNIHIIFPIYNRNTQFTHTHTNIPRALR